jgi:hypothetical protein
VANTWIKPTVIARAALGLLMREIKLPALVWRDPQADFAGKQGDTVTVRLPARAKARKRTLRDHSTPITVDDLTETAVPVKLTDDVYHAAGITDEELTLDVADFGAQVLQPQVRAVAEGLEDQLVTAMTAPAYATTLALGGTDAYDFAVDARTALNKALVPTTDRFLVLGADLEAKFLKHPKMSDVDRAGTDSALRDAFLGRIAGFESYLSLAIPADVGYAFHRTAYTLVTRAPVVPEGAVTGGTETYAGLSMRWLRDYDALYLRDRSILNSYVGAAAVIDGPDGPDQNTTPDFVRAVKLTLT